MADWLAELAAGEKNTDLAVESRHKAWRLAPTRERLVHLCADLELNGQNLQEFLQKELKVWFESGKNSKHRLTCMMQLLLGQYNEAVESLKKSSSVGWSEVNHPGPVVFPFLLLASAGISSIPSLSVIEMITDEMESLFLRWQTVQDDKHPPPRYRDFLLPTLKLFPPASSEQEDFLCYARNLTIKRIRQIVHRRDIDSYIKGARMAVAYAEVCALRDQEKDGLELISEIRHDFLKYSAFRSELRQLVNISPILPAMNKFGKWSPS